MAYQLVLWTFQPPSAGAAFEARRVATLCQSIAARLTLKPALRSAWAITTGWADKVPTSVACMTRMGVLS
ncbi:hypothetical protein D9M70_566340 [compost metagenome]